jgi:hypothetical protein
MGAAVFVARWGMCFVKKTARKMTLKWLKKS